MNTPETARNYKTLTNPLHKPFFAAHFNMGWQNAFIIVRDISERLNLGFGLANDADIFGAAIWKMLENNKEPELSERIIEKLKSHFPFLENLAVKHARFTSSAQEPQPADYAKVMLILLKQLAGLRNFFTHAVHEPYEIQDHLISWLRLLFDASRIVVKERFKYEPTEVEHLVRQGVGGKEKKRFFYPFANADNSIHEKGMAFFICLWLQPKYGQEFLKKLEGFKRSESRSEKATLEAYTVFAAKLPRPKLTSDNTETGLLLDMINELKRCPGGLYGLLHENDQRLFVADTRSEIDNDDETDLPPILKRHGNRFYYFALRYLDITNAFTATRFQVDLGNYCFNIYDQPIHEVIRQRRWIKKMTVFGTLDYFINNEKPGWWYSKLIPLEERTERQHDIYVTDTTPHYHINNNQIGIKITRNSRWPELPIFDSKKPNETTPRTESPDMWLSIYELPALLFYHLLQQKQPELPTAETVIKKHRENIRKFYAKIIDGGEFKPPLSGVQLTAKLKELELEPSHIPTVFLKYLLNVEKISPAKKAGAILESMLEETNRMIKRSSFKKNNYSKKPGSKDYEEIKNGHMADFLARDMVRLQPPVDVNKGKANATEFQVLQASLAYFSSNKDKLPGIFAVCNLVNSRNCHPFLHKIDINNCHGILDFYDQYLTQRHDFLTCIGENQYGSYHFLNTGERIKQTQNDYIKKLAQKFKGTGNAFPKKSIPHDQDISINLPRNLFLEPILNAFKTGSYKEFNQVMKASKRKNVSFIISKYYEFFLNDSSQKFYNFKRSYEFLDKIFDTRKAGETRQPLKRKYFSTEELAGLGETIPLMLNKRIAKQIQKKGPGISEEEKDAIQKANQHLYSQFNENEKQLRLNKTCDMVLFLMAEAMLKRNEKINIGARQANYKLKQITPNASTGILSIQTDIDIDLPYRYETNIDKVKGVQTAKSELSKIYTKKIVRPALKSKNYGDFRRLLKDRKVERLIPYLSQTEIQFFALEREISFFEKARQLVFEKVYEFEVSMAQFEQLQLSAAYLTSEKKHFTHAEILGKAVEKDSLIYNKILAIRNSFSHSQYPPFILFNSDIDSAEFNDLALHKADDRKDHLSIALKFKNLISNYYDSLITNINTTFA